MKRWPVIRHIRYWMAVIEFNRWWQHTGRFLGAVPNEADLRHLENIREGRA